VYKIIVILYCHKYYCGKLDIRIKENKTFFIPGILKSLFSALLSNSLQNNNSVQALHFLLERFVAIKVAISEKRL
jgi:hypothetical protein